MDGKFSTPTVLKAQTDGRLVDGGSNTTITNDPSVLVDVHDIPPIAVNLALTTNNGDSDHQTCTQQGLLPLHCDDGDIHYQPLLINANANETITSPQSIIDNSDIFDTWCQLGHDKGAPGEVKFLGHRVHTQ